MKHRKGKNKRKSNNESKTPIEPYQLEKDDDFDDLKPANQANYKF